MLGFPQNQPQRTKEPPESADEMHIFSVSSQDTEVRADALLYHLPEASFLNGFSCKTGLASALVTIDTFVLRILTQTGRTYQRPSTVFPHPVLPRVTWFEDRRNEETEAQSAILQCSRVTERKLQKELKVSSQTPHLR